MLQRITHAATDLVALLGIEGKIFLGLLARTAGLVALLSICGLVAAVSLLGLSAAAVVALTPQMGVAGALALMSGAVLLVCALLGLTAWSLLLSVHRRIKLDQAEQRLAAEREKAIARIKTPEPTPASAPSSPFAALGALNLSKVDPVLVAASVAAVAAVVGPVRLLRLVAGLAGNVALVSSLVSAGKSVVGAARSNGRP